MGTGERGEGGGGRGEEGGRREGGDKGRKSKRHENIHTLYQDSNDLK